MTMSNELQFQRLFDSLMEGCQIFDYDLIYLYINKAAEHQNRRPNSELLGQCYKEMWPGIEETEVYRLILDTLQNRRPNTIENEFNFPDGEKGWFELRISPVPEGVFVMSLDITQRKLLSLKLKEVEKRKYQAQKMESIGHLAGGIAHDFNNNLTVILGYTEMALSSVAQDSDLIRILREIKKTAKLSAELTQHLLGFARKQNAIPLTVNLNEEIDGSLNFIRRIVGEDITISWAPGKDLYTIKIDPNQLHQILTNLSVNARDAIETIGEISIETGNVTIEETLSAEHYGLTPGNYAVISFSDNGSGMDRETQQQIFDPFFTTKKRGEGTGLGLSTVYGIIRQNNGFINVYSEPGKGTTFRIYLAEHREKEIEKKRDLSPEKHPFQSRGKETILIVDDDESVLTITGEILETMGYRVLTSGDPLDAIETVRRAEDSIDLLITDVVMPNMTGAELSEKIGELNSDIKILYVSGYTANIIARRGLVGEEVNFLAKPYSMTDLGRKIRSVLGPE